MVSIVLKSKPSSLSLLPLEKLFTSQELHIFTFATPNLSSACKVPLQNAQ